MIESVSVPAPASPPSPFPAGPIAFQGIRGAYSEQACREREPARTVLSCRTFEEVFIAVESGAAALGMVPVENSVAGTISDNYDLLASHQLHIVGEHYLRIRHALHTVTGTRLEEIRTVYSHPQALAQCRNFIRDHGWDARAVYDTAGAAADLARHGNRNAAAIASVLCADLYGLTILQRDIQDSDRNTTRFLLLAQEPVEVPDTVDSKISLLFEVKNIPAALYKCLGGFATNGINLTRLESRPIPGRPWSSQFYLDFQGRRSHEQTINALEELRFFTETVTILGCYPEAPRP